MRGNIGILTLCASLLAGIGIGKALGEDEFSAFIPPHRVYAQKHMPSEWWGDDNILAEGKAIYEGRANDSVNCASCHGMNGKPIKKGAHDFSETARMRMFSDSLLFYWISEGIVETKMLPWRSKLPEEDRWRLVAYVASFGLKGMAFDTEKGRWVPVHPGATSR